MLPAAAARVNPSAGGAAPPGDAAQRAGDEPAGEPVPVVPAERLLAYADAPPLAPEEPDDADRSPLLPLELLAWSGEQELVGVRCTAEAVVLRSGRPPARRRLTVRRLTRWARAGRVTLHCDEADVELRLLDPGEYAGLSLGDVRERSVPGPLRAARSGARAARGDEVARTLIGRVLRVAPEVQVGNE